MGEAGLRVPVPYGAVEPGGRLERHPGPGADEDEVRDLGGGGEQLGPYTAAAQLRADPRGARHRGEQGVDAGRRRRFQEHGHAGVRGGGEHGGGRRRRIGAERGERRLDQGGLQPVVGSHRRQRGPQPLSGVARNRRVGDQPEHQPVVRPQFGPDLLQPAHRDEEPQGVHRMGGGPVAAVPCHRLGGRQRGRREQTRVVDEPGQQRAHAAGPRPAQVQA
ncbi:hypothetical protein [Streptomyces sp. B146]|uniref:hypothetical protein n=1 Tax=Streptomyces sp. B146 TaxID=2944251 RepID=UPI00244EF640|nr:hypothetical protein [Streptomyces sp. B146]WGK44821.1 hypothetical protein M6G09_03890 [Streptomyces sp. B146]